MIHKDDLVSLSYEQKRKFNAAIDRGYFDDFERNPREWKRTFVGAFIWRYPRRTNLIEILTKLFGHLPEWSDMTFYNLKDVVDELQAHGFAQSSVRTLCSELKAVLNENHHSVPCDRYDFSNILSVKGTVSQAVYLTRDEMKKIMKYKPESPVEKYVKRNFVVEMLTGARLIDSMKLSMNNCDPGTGMLSYVPEKTPNLVVRVPVDEKLRLRPYLADTTEMLVYIDKFNDTIRDICRKCGINSMQTITRRSKTETGEKWQFVSSHTARRSFATNLFLAGISLEDIAMMMGHGKNIETTKNYICAYRNASKFLISYFRPERKKPEDIDAHSYNKAIDDVISHLVSQDVIVPDGLIQRNLDEMKLPTK